MHIWMTIKDVSRYLQISENKIRFLMRHEQIPFHNNHGFLRFNLNEIDEWMKTSSFKEEDKQKPPQDVEIFHYRSKPVKDYSLTATKIFIGKKPWNRLPKFIRDCVERVNEIRVHDNSRDFLYRREFSILMNNFNDYLKVSFQLGLIEKMKGGKKEKHYYPTIYAERIYATQDSEETKKIILDCILDIVSKHLETVPNERHSIILLWHILTIKERGIEPSENHFRKNTSELKSYYPLIRLNFSKSLCAFLFEDEREREQQFFDEWKRIVS
jgi:hypothetical protein